MAQPISETNPKINEYIHAHINNFTNKVAIHRTYEQLVEHMHNPFLILIEV